MAENKVADSKSTKPAETKPADTKQEATEPTAEELKAMRDALPDTLKEAIDTVNADIESHNKNVTSIVSAEAKDPKLIKAEIFEQNPDNNKKLAAIYAEYEKMVQAAEKLRENAYAVIEADGLMPKELTEAEIEKLKSSTSESAKTLKDRVFAMAQFEEMMPTLKGKILPLITEIKTRRGTAKTGTTKTGEGPKRIRFKRIEINNQVEDDNGNKVYGIANGEEKYTFTFASMYLRKQHKGIKWSANDLTDAYLKGIDENNLPEVREFVMPYTYKNNEGNEVTVNYTVKCFR